MNKNLTINLAKDEYGKDLVIDLAIVKHLLIAGSTGSGKSVLLHNIVSTLLTNNSPEYLKLILIDPKRVEMTVYTNIPHILTPTILDPKKAVLAMKWTVKKINRRLDIFKDAGYKDISEYKGSERIPSIVIVVDEFSDLIQTYPKEIEPVVLKIAQMGHVVGVYIILSTSRPSTKVLTKSILDAIPARIAMQTSSVQDSKLIIGTGDACMLRGSGDLLFRDGLKYIVRGQGKLISYEDVKAQCKSLCEEYKDDVQKEIISEGSTDDSHDDLFDEAREAVMSAGKASTSYIQRKLGVGYSRAAQLMDMLEDKGVIGPASGAKPRDVIQQEVVH